MIIFFIQQSSAALACIRHCSLPVYWPALPALTSYAAVHCGRRVHTEVLHRLSLRSGLHTHIHENVRLSLCVCAHCIRAIAARWRERALCERKKNFFWPYSLLGSPVHCCVPNAVTEPTVYGASHASRPPCYRWPLVSTLYEAHTELYGSVHIMSTLIMSTLCTPLQVPPVRCSVFVLFCSQFSELSSGSACVCVCSIRFRSANSVASAWLYLCKWSRFVSQQTIRIGLRSKRAAAIGKLSICAKCERTSRWAALPLFSFSKKKTKIQAFCLCGVGISYSSRALCFAWPNSPRTASVSPFEPANSRFQVSIDRSNSVSGRQLNFHPIISGAFEAIFGVSPVSVSSAFSVFVYKYVRTIRCQACAIVLVWWCFDDHLRLVSWGALWSDLYASIWFNRVLSYVQWTLSIWFNECHCRISTDWLALSALIDTLTDAHLQGFEVLFFQAIYLWFSFVCVLKWP